MARKSSSRKPTTPALDAVTARAKEKPIGADKEIQARAKTRAEETLKEFQIQSTLQTMTTASLAISGSLTQLQERLINEHQNLLRLQEAIAVKDGELQTLHDKEVVARELDEMIAHYNAERARLDNEIAEAERQFEDERADALQTRQREEAQYEYTRDLARRQTEDAWATSRAALQRNEDVREQELKRGWNLREQELQEKERRFPAEVAALKAQHEAQVQAISSNLKTEARFAKAEADREKQLLQQEIAQYKERLIQRDAEIAELRTARAQSEQHVRDIALRGLDTASSKLAFAEGALVQRGNDAGGGNSTRKPS